MSDLIVRSVPALPETFVLPFRPSYPLENEVDLLVNPHPNLRKRTRFSSDVIAQARNQLALIEPMLQPASRRLIELWMLPIADATEFVPGGKGFQRRVEAIELAAGDIPYPAWNRQAQRIGISEWTSFPSAAAVLKLVRGPVQPLIARARALRWIVAAEVGAKNAASRMV
jgi:hypothetical protein